jgi:serine/threonine protein kinase
VAHATARLTLPDRYRVVRHIANGGMASVWEAHDELLDRRVAVKVLGSPVTPTSSRSTTSGSTRTARSSSWS